MLDILEISPYAYIKIAAIQTLTSNECSGFGVLNEKNQVVDFRLVEHEATTVSIEFDEDAQDAYMLDQAMNGNTRLITNLWWHTHPCGPSSSGVDDKMFGEMQKSLNVAIMLIYGSDDTFSCRIATNQEGFRNEWEAKVKINHQIPWPDDAENIDIWRVQVAELCKPKRVTNLMTYPLYGKQHRPSTYVPGSKANEFKYVPPKPSLDLEFDGFGFGDELTQVPEDKDDPAMTVAELEELFYDELHYDNHDAEEKQGIIAAWEHAVYGVIPNDETFPAAWIEAYDKAWAYFRRYAKFAELLDEGAQPLKFVDIV